RYSHFSQGTPHGGPGSFADANGLDIGGFNQSDLNAELGGGVVFRGDGSGSNPARCPTTDDHNRFKGSRHSTSPEKFALYNSQSKKTARRRPFYSAIQKLAFLEGSRSEEHTSELQSR